MQLVFHKIGCQPIAKRETIRSPLVDELERLARENDHAPGDRANCGPPIDAQWNLRADDREPLREQLRECGASAERNVANTSTFRRRSPPSWPPFLLHHHP